MFNSSTRKAWSIVSSILFLMVPCWCCIPPYARLPNTSNFDVVLHNVQHFSVLEAASGMQSLPTLLQQKLPPSALSTFSCQPRVRSMWTMAWEKPAFDPLEHRYSHKTSSVAARQPQRFQKSSSFVTGSTRSVVIGPLHGGPIVQFSLSIHPFSSIVFDMSWKSLPPHDEHKGFAIGRLQGQGCARTKTTCESTLNENSPDGTQPHPETGGQIKHIAFC